MAEYRVPREDMQFVLQDVFQVDKDWAESDTLAELDMETAFAIIDEGAKLAESLIAPLARAADEEGVSFDNGTVTTPTGYKENFQQLAAGGWVGVTANPEFGGMGLPKSVSAQYEEMLCAADISFSLYPGLTAGAIMTIDQHADSTLKATYLEKLVAGQWTGSMCLTEPHAGTDLGIIRTKATPNADGSYAITGTKIFITGDEHDLAENIIHLVLAKLPDAPAGSKGISLFLVPKFLSNNDGSLGARNAVSCGSIEHKMGIKASATCVMNFDGATGWLIGEPNRGLAAMFTMMNYERLSIGIQGIGCAEASFQNAVAYACDRLQGRAASGPVSADRAADPIIVHPDVRRMLLTMKAMTEGGRAFACFVGQQLDLARHAEDADERRDAEALVALLTPVAKAFFTDSGLESCVLGQQVLGGHGYIREWGQEQRVRDVRIAQIYEGTNGIQALDLLGRKVVADGGANLRHFCALMRESATTGPYAEELRSAIERLEATSGWLLEQARHNPTEIGAASVDYLHLFGYTAYAWLWARMDQLAEQRHAEEPDFYAGKRATAEFFFRRLLPRTLALEASIRAGS